MARAPPGLQCRAGLSGGAETASVLRQTANSQKRSLTELLCAFEGDWTERKAAVLVAAQETLNVWDTDDKAAMPNSAFTIQIHS